MENKVLLSFILPLFNVEKYISECVHSLYAQDIPIDNYEVIIVNDCSPDSSRSIVIALQEVYSTLILVDLEQNSKQGAARNAGLKVAVGEYIWFVDSDDFVKPNVLKGLIKIMSDNHLDILHFDYARVTLEGKIEEIYDTKYTTDVMTGLNFFHHEGEIWWKKDIEVWRKLHSKNFLIQNHIEFEEHVFFEDFLYSIKSIILATRIMHVSQTPYCYRDNPTSFMNSKETGEKLSESVKLNLKCIEFCDYVKNIDVSYVKLLMDFVKCNFNVLIKKLAYLPIREQHFFFKKIKNETLIKESCELSRISYCTLSKPILSMIFLLPILRIKTYLRSKYKNNIIQDNN